MLIGAAALPTLTPPRTVLRTPVIVFAREVPEIWLLSMQTS
jgi:hypothetical protein